MTPPIAVIIIHFHSLANTQKCVRSVLQSQCTHPILPIILDGSHQASEVEQLHKEFDDKIVIELTTGNLGFTGFNNRGIRLALERQARTIILLNDDATVDPHTIAILDETLHSQPNIGMVVPKIYFTAHHEFHHGYRAAERGQVLWYAGGQIDWREMVAWHRGVDEVDHGQYDHSEITPYATGCCVALKPLAIQQNGALDDRYFLYWEDVELSLRWQRASWQIIYQPQAKAWHDNAGSSGSGSATHVYYQTRNRFLIGFRYAPWRTKLFLAKQLLTLLRHGEPVVQCAILDYVTHQYGQRLQPFPST
jgi:GT2 family glycosyltransferase